ncbi:MAG TPA: twin-arginine translocation signal domain-containing protein [Pseudonocardiaceae bacterium]
MAGHAWTRRDFLKGSATAGGLTVAGSVFAACTSTGSGGSALADARRTGTIKVGIAGEVPYGFTANGRSRGRRPRSPGWCSASWGSLTCGLSRWSSTA